MIKARLIIGLLISFILGRIACVHKPLEVPIETGLFSRSSSWVTDTLYKVDYMITGIWAVSPSNVYLVGSGGGIWHYDGTTWTPIPFHYTTGGPIYGIIELEAIWGFSSSDIWVAGAHLYYNPTPTTNFDRSALLAHFDGNTWTEVQLDAGKLFSAWGQSSTEIWVGSDSGRVYHFNGSTWAPDSVEGLGMASGYFGHIVGRESIPPFATVYGPYQERRLLQRQSAVWKVLEATTSSANDIYHLWLSPNNTLYAAGAKICRWNGSSWQPLRSAVLPSILNVLGSADNNLFAVGYSGFFSHFNGIDWHDVQELKQVAFIYDGWTNGTHVFLVAHGTNGESLIIRNN